MPEIGDIKKNKYNNKSRWSACDKCGKGRWVQLRFNNPINQHCQSCANGITNKKRRAELSRNWRGGRIVSGGGYIKIKLQPNDFFFSMVDCTNYVFEHRLVVARALGRCLHLWEIVHHRGIKYSQGSIENRQDNRPENLQLVSDDRHKQISLMERRIANLEARVTLLEAEKVILQSEREVHKVRF